MGVSESGLFLSFFFFKGGGGGWNPNNELFQKEIFDED